MNLYRAGVSVESKSDTLWKLDILLKISNYLSLPHSRPRNLKEFLCFEKSLIQDTSGEVNLSIRFFLFPQKLIARRSISCLFWGEARLRTYFFILFPLIEKRLLFILPFPPTSLPGKNLTILSIPELTTSSSLHTLPLKLHSPDLPSPMVLTLLAQYLLEPLAFQKASDERLPWSHLTKFRKQV